MDARPIGIFDSGIGGLTAVREVMRTMPDEKIIYFGDTGRVPYGTRSQETIIRYARQDIRFLLTFDIKAVVVACGTVSSAALGTIGEEYGIPLIGVVEPASKAAVKATKNRRIGVIGTQSTIKSGAYKKKLLALMPGAVVIEAACPLFVPFVENGRFLRGDRALEIIAGEYLRPLAESGLDTLILGCTHYPLLREIIGDVMGPDVMLIDSGRAAAEHVGGVLTQRGLLSPGAGRGENRFFASDDPEGFSNLAGIFLCGRPCGTVEYVEIEKY